jgi:hypothetical protein
MQASVGHYYSKIDKCHIYCTDAVNFWTWFAIGQEVPKGINLYPYFHDFGKRKIKRYTFESDDYSRLGRKCGKKLRKLFEKYGK